MLLTIAVVSLLGVDEAAIGKFAESKVPKYIDEVLKSPSTAKYSVKSVKAAARSSTLAPGRYIVDGAVDAQNGFGAMMRMGWKASVRVGDNDKLELLVVAVGDDDKTKFLYQAPAEMRYRKEVYEGVRADYRAWLERMKPVWAKTPVKKRQALQSRDIKKQLAEVCKRFQLDVTDVNEILGLRGRD